MNFCPSIKYFWLLLLLSVVLCVTDAYAEEISLSSLLAMSFKAQCPQRVDDLRGAFNIFVLTYHDTSVGFSNSIIIHKKSYLMGWLF